MIKRSRKGPVYWGQTNQGDVKKSARRALLSGVVLFLIVLAVGIGYTYYADSNTPPRSAAAPPSSISNSTGIVTHTKPPKNAAVGAAVEAFTSLVKPGDQASISIRTTPGATCKIEVLYNHVPDPNSALKPQTADDFGGVTWDWTVGPATPNGMWPVNVTCARNGKSGFVQAQLNVSG